jgi:hypothetical protein
MSQVHGPEATTSSRFTVERWQHYSRSSWELTRGDAPVDENSSRGKRERGPHQLQGRAAEGSGSA